MLVRLQVRGIQLDPRDGRAVVLLGHASGAVFPLWVHDVDAAAIARPDSTLRGPHNLLADVVQALGAVVESARITGIVGGVVQAELSLHDGEHVVVLGARAADAIAVAARSGAVILVDDALLDQVNRRVTDAEHRLLRDRQGTAAEPVQQSTAERWNALLSHLSASGESKVYEA